jgi:hypothetical protein
VCAARLRLAGLVVVAAALNVGCQSASVRFTSYADPFFPEHRALRFSTCAYRTEAGGDLLIAARMVDGAGDQAAEHFLCAHVFWRPQPGRTFAEETMTDALLRYVVSDAAGTRVYAGTGFAYPKKTWLGGLTVQLESGRLRLESQTGDSVDELDDMRLVGLLEPTRDAGAASHLARAAEVLASK